MFSLCSSTVYCSLQYPPKAMQYVRIGHRHDDAACVYASLSVPRMQGQSDKRVPIIVHILSF